MALVFVLRPFPFLCYKSHSPHAHPYLVGILELLNPSAFDCGSYEKSVSLIEVFGLKLDLDSHRLISRPSFTLCAHSIRPISIIVAIIVETSSIGTGPEVKLPGQHQFLIQTSL